MPVARATDPWPSWAAARAVGDVTGKQAAVYWMFRTYGPMSLSQLVERYEYERTLARPVEQRAELPAQSPSGIRTRAKELVNLRLIEPSGRYRTNDAGNRERLLAVVVPETLF